MAVEAVAPAKTYSKLTETPGAHIGRCAQVLPNRMQCPKAADVQVVEGEESYQLCLRHALAEQKTAATK
jgi:hypothetical protein